MSNPVDVGVGGAVALLIIERVLHFLGVWNTKPKNGGSSGDRSVEFWRETFRQMFTEILDHRLALMVEGRERLSRQLDEILANQKSILRTLWERRSRPRE